MLHRKKYAMYRMLRKMHTCDRTRVYGRYPRGPRAHEVPSLKIAMVHAQRLKCQKYTYIVDYQTLAATAASYQTALSQF